MILPSELSSDEWHILGVSMQFMDSSSSKYTLAHFSYFLALSAFLIILWGSLQDRVAILFATRD